jgi:hypothetical protein
MARTSSVHLHKPYHTIRRNMEGVYGYVRGHTLVLTAASFHPDFDPRSTEPGWVVGADASLVSSFRYSDLRLTDERRDAWSEEIEAILILERDPMVMQRIKLVLSQDPDCEYHWVAYPTDATVPPLRERPHPYLDKKYDRTHCTRGDSPDDAAVKILEHFFWSMLRDATNVRECLGVSMSPDELMSGFLSGEPPVSPGNWWLDLLAGSVTRAGRNWDFDLALELRCMLFGLPIEEVTLDPENSPVFRLTKGLAELASEAIERLMAPEEPKDASMAS